MSNKITNLSVYPILDCSLESLKIGSKCIINTLNQYSFTIAEEDEEFKVALKSSDVLLPDGIGIVVAVKFINDLSITKIAGADIHNHLLQQLNLSGGKCFYLGSSIKTLTSIQNKLRIHFPNIEVSNYSPPFMPVFSDEENEKIVGLINDFTPDILFVGLTAPRQEIWVFRHKHLLSANIICSIGAVFDFYSGNINRPSAFWRNLGLEWFIRLVKEPKRLSKRYLYYGATFLYLLLKMKFDQLLLNYQVHPEID